MIIITFLLWTLLIYFMHRLAHVLPGMTYFHQDHHLQTDLKTNNGWHWSNIFLYNDTWKSTVDLWLTEVIPTLIFCYIFDVWWLMVFYYLWSALVQEAVEHNLKINLYPFLTSGRWHMIHHKYANKNYGIFFPIWDIIFRTWKKI